MSKEEVKKGELIAEKLRKSLLNIDLRIVYAECEKEASAEDFKLYSKLGSKPDIRKALNAKARTECYKVYIKNLSKIKGKISEGLDMVLSRYSPKYKRIWVMYFLEQANIDDICVEVYYSRENVNKIIKKFKNELTQNYGEMVDEN